MGCAHSPQFAGRAPSRRHRCITVRCNCLSGAWHNVKYEHIFRAIKFVNMRADADKTQT